MLKRLFLATAFLLPTPSLAEGEVTIKVMTFNIWYGGDQVSFDSVIDAIKAADADVVGLQEPDGKTLQIAALAGYPYADVRRHILSRFPIFDSGSGETTSAAAPPYSTAGLDPDAVHAWVMVAPGKVIAVANTHLTADPYGPELVRDGSTLPDVLTNEADTRVPEAEALIAGLKPMIDQGTPVVLTGDFNAPSHRDWMVGNPLVVEWPVSVAMEAAGFVDSFRAAHPDAAAVPGITWTPGRPVPLIAAEETLDRIDFIWAAHAETLESTLVGEAGNSAVGIAVTPWPSDHRAVVSTLSVTPVDAPALITVEPRPVMQGDSFLLRVNSPAGATYSAVVVPAGSSADEGVLTGIAGVDPADRPTVRLSTIGMTPGPFDAVLLDEAGTELTRTRFHILPNGATAQIALTQDKVLPGGDIALTFQGAPGFKLDWVGVYRKGEPSVYNYLGFAYTGARIAGDLVFPAAELYEELTPGDYELRLMFDDHYQTLAIAPFAVTAD